MSLPSTTAAVPAGPPRWRQGLKQAGYALLRPVVRRRGRPDRLYLTFDDGPHETVTPALLALLRRAGVRATFFMTGEAMHQHPQWVAEAQADGHAIGLHGAQHTHVHELSWWAQWQDLRAMARTARQFGLRFRLYRPPYGELSVLRLLYCALSGVRIWLWTQDSGDSFVPDAATLLAQAAHWPLHGGEVLLFHDDSALTLQALPALLERFERQALPLAPLD